MKKNKKNGTGENNRKGFKPKLGLSKHSRSRGESKNKDGIRNLFQRLSKQLNYYLKSIDEYIDAMYNVGKSLDENIDLNTLRTLTLSSITLDQLKNRILDKNSVDQYIKQLDNRIKVSTKSLREDRLRDYAKNIYKELKQGNIDKKGFQKTYNKLAEIVERSLLQYENYDIEKFSRKLH